VLVLGLVACDDPLLPPASSPAIIEPAVASSSANVLGAVVSARVSDADSVLALFREDGAGGVDDTTPSVKPEQDSVRVPVLGLLPAATYDLRLVAYGPGGQAASPSLRLVTDTLPGDLPRYTAGGADPAPGFVAFAAGKYGLVIDNTGRVVWYHRFEPNGPFLNFQAQPNGRYVGLPVTPDPNDVEQFVEVDPLGNETRRLGCVGGLVARFHDLIAQPQGDYWIMCDETRTMDLTAVGGQAAAKVTGTVVQHVGNGGALLFQWSPFDHFEITDLDSASRTGAMVNWTHGNALDFDDDGNLIVSFRSLSEITKINVTTGEVMWRMGGLRNQFSFVGAPQPVFARQHGVRRPGAGRLVLLDNLGDPAGSRAEAYEFDAQARSVRLVSAYSPTPAVRALLGGSAQDLPGGHTLVAFGNGNRVEEYDASGGVVWRIEGDAGYVFRAQRIQSLYQPGVGTPR
jgi:hypothetical protein